jgi:hypothetical protein
MKCDQIRPACSQCVRVAVQCPGYRNPLDLLFRDQRQGVEQRVHGRTENLQLSTSRYHNNPKRSTLSQSNHTIAPISLGLQLTHSISPAVADLAAPLFLDYFAVEDTSSGHALISCLPERISSAEDSYLSAAISSVGYAILFNFKKSPDMLIKARRKYTTAVHLTRKALQNPTESDKYQLLLVVLLLALFEVSS